MRKTVSSIATTVAAVSEARGESVAWYMAYFCLGYIACKVLAPVWLVCFPIA